jgi:hypothetical protein
MFRDSKLERTLINISCSIIFQYNITFLKRNSVKRIFLFIDFFKFRQYRVKANIILPHVGATRDENNGF